MTNIESTGIAWKKLLQAAALGAFAVAPLAGAMTAQADPPDHAPAWGYRNKDNDNNRRSGRNNDTNRREFRTLEGVVTNDGSGNTFTIRTNNSQRILVELDENEPRGLNKGDTVRVSGYFRDRDSNDRRDNNVFHANSVTILNNRNNRGDGDRRYNDRRDRDRREYRTLEGRVKKDRPGDSFKLRTSNNQEIDVEVVGSEPRRLSNGDRVRVSGYFRDRDSNDRRDNNEFHATSVTILDDNDNNNNRNNRYDNNSTVDFKATVVDSQDRNNTLRVRGDNGREYSVRTNDAEDYRRGQRVRIKGYAQSGVIFARDIDRI